MQIVGCVIPTDDEEAAMDYSLAYRIGFHPWEDAEARRVADEA